MNKYLSSIAKRSVLNGGFNQNQTILRTGVMGEKFSPGSKELFNGKDKVTVTGPLDRRTSQVTKAINKPGIPKI